MAKRPATLEEASEEIRKLWDIIDRLESQNLDIKRRRVVNASQAVHDHDYIIKQEFDAALEPLKRPIITGEGGGGGTDTSAFGSLQFPIAGAIMATKFSGPLFGLIQRKFSDYDLFNTFTFGAFPEWWEGRMIARVHGSLGNAYSEGDVFLWAGRMPPDFNKTITTPELVCGYKFASSKTGQFRFGVSMTKVTPDDGVSMLQDLTFPLDGTNKVDYDVTPDLNVPSPYDSLKEVKWDLTFDGGVQAGDMYIIVLQAWPPSGGTNAAVATGLNPHGTVDDGVTALYFSLDYTRRF